MRTKAIYIYLMLLFIPTRIYAQDIHFSQYMHNALNRSAACTGFFDGDIRANAAYRSQWKSVTVPYRTFSFSYDQVLGNINNSGSRNAVGMLINNDKAGDGNLSNLQLLASYAHLFSLGTDSVYFINAGVQGGLSYRKIDFSNLTFDNQYNGDVFNSALSTGEQFERLSYVYPELNVGVEGMAVFDNNIFTAGFSFQHLTRPGNNFLKESVKLPIRSQYNASAWINKNDKVSYNPSVILMKQQSNSELTGGLEVKLDLKKDAARNYAFGAGCHYRVNDAIIPGISLYYNQWRMGLSYDINTSGFKKATNGRGGPEFNVTYIMKKIRYVVRKNNCPVY